MNNDISKKIKGDMVRMRLQPKLYDYCYSSTTNNIHVINKLHTYLKNKEAYTVVDLGCGNKPFKEIFSNKVNYIGIDFSPDTKADIVSDFTDKIPMESNSADVVILSEVLEHLPNPYQILTEVKRIIKPNGLIYISTPFAFPIHGKPHDYFRFTEYFYRALEDKFSFTLLELKYSNMIISTPLLLILHIIMPLPYVPYLLKQFISLIINSSVLAVETTINFILKIAGFKGRAVKFLGALPLGYATIFKFKE